MAARKEVITLNPKEVATEGRIEHNLHFEATQVREGGIDWGDTAIEAFTAEQSMGSIPIDYRLPNRVITIPLILGAVGDFDATRIALQAECSRITEEGGWLKRELIGGTYGEAGSHLFCDLVKATLKYSGGTPQASDGFDPEVELTLEALPDFYGDEEVGELHEGTGDLSWTEQIQGNLPGRVTSLTVTDKSGNDQLGLGWAFRCKNYGSASTAAWAYEAEALLPLDLAAEQALMGASGGQTIRHNNLSTSWTPVLAGQIFEITKAPWMTHQGVYDVWARVYTTSATLPWLRLLWGVGDISNLQENAQVRIPGANNFYLVNLGQVNLRAKSVGFHRWQPIIEARGQVGGENIYIDKMWFQNGDESSGVLTAARKLDVPPLGYKARDFFNQTEGVLTGKAAEIGGKNYVALAGSDADDFSVTATHKLKRSAVSDTGTAAYQGRAVGLGLGLTNQMAEITFTRSVLGTYGATSGLILRASSAENYVRVYYADFFGLAGVVVEVVRGNVQRVVSTKFMTPRLTGTLKAGVIGDDFVIFLDEEQIVPDSINLQPNDQLSLLPAGGVYISDSAPKAEVITREYDNFAVWVPARDAVLFANHEAQLTSGGMYRQPAVLAEGDGYGDVAYPGADLPRIPVSGPEARPVEISLKPSRGDFATIPDAGLDKVAGQLSYRPAWSFVPGS